jgi:hypothetical protein
VYRVRESTQVAFILFFAKPNKQKQSGDDNTTCNVPPSPPERDQHQRVSSFPRFFHVPVASVRCPVLRLRLRFLT